MWINKAERAWRRAGETRQLCAKARAAEAHFAAFDRAVSLLMEDATGCRHLARHGITRRWCQRSRRQGKGGVEGMSVLEGVILRGICSQILDDASFVRWMSHARPEALRALHSAVGDTVPDAHPGA